MDDAPHLAVRPVAEADIRDFATWRYAPPLDVYNIAQTIDEAVEYFLRPSTGCHVILSGGELAAFFTFGEDARVPGGDYSNPGLDIGLGVNPSLIGRGAGRSYVETVVGFALETFDIEPLRVTIAAENRAALCGVVPVRIRGDAEVSCGRDGDGQQHVRGARERFGPPELAVKAGSRRPERSLSVHQDGVILATHRDIFLHIFTKR